MATEIERKFLVCNDAWRQCVEDETQIRQGYLSECGATTVRARIRDDLAYLTVKGPTKGVSRLELEYRIPVEDAEVMLRELAVSAVIEKTRFRVRHGDHVWDLDVFAGENAGLILAEIELDSEDAAFDRPTWVGDEVSNDPRYFNASLSKHPYRRW